MGHSRFGGGPTNRHYSTIHSVTQSYVTKAFHLQAHCGNPAILIAVARYPALSVLLHPLSLSLLVPLMLLPFPLFWNQSWSIPYYVFHATLSCSVVCIVGSYPRLMFVLYVQPPRVQDVQSIDKYKLQDVPNGYSGLEPKDRDALRTRLPPIHGVLPTPRYSSINNITSCSII